jgi:NAD(P)-dependent dehydrogenase (short-subunit alcohol dehydrogenase family)
MSFENKAVLITGSTRGIGLATARAFLNEGARVAINGQTRGSVERAIAELGVGKRLFATPGSVGSPEGCNELVARAIAHMDGLDVLVNNAGVYEIASMQSSDEPLWDSIMDVNVKGTFFCSRAALQSLKAARGTIVNVASVCGLAGYADTTVYCASKGAVVNMTRAMAMELAPDVRVNCVCPATVDTEMGRKNFEPGLDLALARKTAGAEKPLKRIAVVEEVAAAILYLASDQAGFITGAALPLDGGMTAGA